LVVPEPAEPEVEVEEPLSSVVPDAVAEEFELVVAEPHVEAVAEAEQVEIEITPEPLEPESQPEEEVAAEVVFPEKAEEMLPPAPEKVVRLGETPGPVLNSRWIRRKLMQLNCQTEKVSLSNRLRSQKTLMLRVRMLNLNCPLPNQ
jgi:hypothetical protein